MALPRHQDGAFNVRTDPVLLSVLVVEAPRDISRELEVLALVLAHWDEVGLVEQDVRRHQHRVVEQTHARGVGAALCRLLLNWIIRSSQPIGVAQLSIHASSECSRT